MCLTAVYPSSSVSYGKTINRNHAERPTLTHRSLKEIESGSCNSEFQPGRQISIGLSGGEAFALADQGLYRPDLVELVVPVGAARRSRQTADQHIDPLRLQAIHAGQ